MPKHIKPTKAELEANSIRLLEEAEALELEENKDKPEVPTELPEDDPQPTPKFDDEVETPETEETPEPEDGEEGEEEPEKTPEKPEITPEKTPDPKDEPDYKEKFGKSTQEAQILFAKSNKLADIIEQASNLPEPTEEEMTALYKDEWELMSDRERENAKESYIGKRYRNFISEGTKEFKDIDAWTKKVEEFVDDPATLVKTPELEGKTEEFMTFANKPTRRGVDFEDLVSAFLFDVSKNAKPKNKGAMFEKGSGGLNDKPNNAPKKLTSEQGTALRKQNYSLWLQYAKAGKIDNEI